RPARAVLIGEHADTGAVSNQVSVIGEIHDRGTKFEHAAIVRYRYALGDARIDLDIERQVPGIRKSASKSASIDPIDAERESMPVVNDPGGIGECLVVIQKDIVTADVLQFVRREVELSGLHLRTLRDAIGEVLVGVDIFVSVRTRELDSPNAPLVIVECFEDKRRPELALVDKLRRLLVIGIDADV